MFKKLKELLEAGKITQELADNIDAEISARVKELNDENAGLRVENKNLKAELANFEATQNSLQEQIAAKDKAIKKAKEDGKNEVVKDLENQKKEMQALQESLEARLNENKALKIENALNSALSNYDVIDNELVSSYLKGYVNVDNDAIKYKDGENLLTLEDGLKKFFENKQHLLKPKGNGGSGADNGGNSGGGTLSVEDMYKI